MKSLDEPLASAAMQGQNARTAVRVSLRNTFMELWISSLTCMRLVRSKIINISGSGVFIEVPCSMQVGVLVHCRLLMQGKILTSVDGKVVRLQPSDKNNEMSRLALHFMYHKDNSRDPLVRYIFEQKARQRRMDIENENGDRLLFLDDFREIK